MNNDKLIVEVIFVNKTKAIFTVPLQRFSYGFSAGRFRVNDQPIVLLPWYRDGGWYIAEAPDGKIDKIEWLKQDTLKTSYVLREDLMGTGNFASAEISQEDWDKLSADRAEVLSAFYEKIEVKGDPYWTELPFDAVELCRIDNYPFLNNKFEVDTGIVAESEYTGNKSYEIAVNGVRHDKLDLLLTPPPLVAYTKATIAGNTLYEIIRQHVKRRKCDGSVWRITSDYDFVFEVQKVYKLVEPYESITIGDLMKKKKCPARRLVTEKMCPAFRITTSSKKYEGAEVITALEAENEFELDRKLKELLSRIDAFLDTPLVQCEHCAGRGYELQTQLKLKELLG